MTPSKIASRIVLLTVLDKTFLLGLVPYIGSTVVYSIHFVFNTEFNPPSKLKSFFKL